MTDLAQLLKESKSIKKQPSVSIIPIQKLRKLPDALVLVVTEITCLNCTNKYTFPNIHLLIRIDRQRTRIREWLDIYNTVPRERLIIKEKADRCQSCFNDAMEMYINGND